MRKQTIRERGTSAVEFALVVPMFITLAFGIIEYGNYFKLVNQADSAAMVGARSLSLNNTTTVAKDAAAAAAGSSFSASDFVPTACSSTNSSATMVVNKTYVKLFGLVPTPATVKGKGVVRCES